MNNTYVYIHKRLSDDIVFYVGIGKGDRAFSLSRRNAYWKNVVAKHGYCTCILQQNLSWEEACSIEISLIAHYRIVSGDKLTNICDGGEGAVGPKSEQTKEKLRLANLGKKQSAETIAKRVLAHKGKKRSAETCKNISRGQKGNKRSVEAIAKGKASHAARSEASKSIQWAKFQATIEEKRRVRNLSKV